MKIVIDTTKSIEENATRYYDKSKKAKRKFEGLKKAIDVSKKKIAKVDKEVNKEKKVYKEIPEKKWYMKFRWFISTDGFLCFGGRDAMTNDIVIKKHTEKDDLVLHTELPGSPFFVIKSEGKEIPENTINEAAIATASYSRAWRDGFTSSEVYVIKPEQVKKELGLPKGTFMIHGQRKYITAVVKLYIGINKDGYIECSPVKMEWELVPEGKKTDTAKKLQYFIKEKYEMNYPLDDIVRVMPGDCSIKK